MNTYDPLNTRIATAVAEIALKFDGLSIRTADLLLLLRTAVLAGIDIGIDEATSERPTA